MKIRFKTGTKSFLVFCEALNIPYIDYHGSGFQADVPNILYDCFKLGPSSFSRLFIGGTLRHFLILRHDAAADLMLFLP